MRAVLLFLDAEQQVAKVEVPEGICLLHVEYSEVRRAGAREIESEREMHRDGQGPAILDPRAVTPSPRTMSSKTFREVRAGPETPLLLRAHYL